MEYQYRSYDIAPGRAADFAREWDRSVKPLRESAGFVIEAAWVLPVHDRFVWVVGWPGPGTFADADERYYRSSARTGLDPDPARLIVSAEELPAQRVELGARPPRAPEDQRPEM